jgi:hypothetical protein
VTTRTLHEPRIAHKKRGDAGHRRERLVVRLWTRLGTEARSLLPIWIFFLFSFSLLRLTQNVILRDAGIGVIPPSKVFVGSLIVAKALLTVDRLRLFNRFQHSPILIMVVLKSLAYMLVAFVFQYSQGIYEHRHLVFTEAAREVAHRFTTARFWVIQIWLLVLIAAFTASREFARRIGRSRFRRLFLGR